MGLSSRPMDTKKFRELICRLAEQGKVALQIDEYDKPLTDLLENKQKVQDHVDTRKDFYLVLKAAAVHLSLGLSLNLQCIVS